MAIGMFMHRLANPKPPPPAFTVTIPSRLSQRKGTFPLLFYVPRDYEIQRQQRLRTYAVVVNFHGGGFTLGDPHDDARWVNTVVEEVDVVVVSVGYRLAPEHPFPTAVEDGADAVLFLVEHAAEYNLDPSRIALSGFSSGGNMAFTVPLRLSGEIPMNADNEVFQTPVGASTDKATVRVWEQAQARLRGVVAFYPSTDYTQTREQRRATAVRKDQLLPAVFTELFDQSYLHPPTLDTANPLLSPSVAPVELLQELPSELVIFTCEWDMVLKEAELFRDKLVNEVRKNVRYYMVPGVPHAWDKAPNPISPTPGVLEHYMRACDELKRILQLQTTLAGK